MKSATAVQSTPQPISQSISLSTPTATPMTLINPIQQIGIFDVLNATDGLYVLDATDTTKGTLTLDTSTPHTATDTSTATTPNNVIHVDFTSKKVKLSRANRTKAITILKKVSSEASDKAFSETFAEASPAKIKKRGKTSTAHTKTTVAITNRDTLAAIKQQLLESSPTYGLRNYMIFYLGINIGLRAGDLLTLLIEDVWDYDTQTVKPEITIVEEKTHKDRLVFFNPDLRKDLKDYILTLHDHRPDAPLFQSRKKHAKHGERAEGRWVEDTGCLEANSYGKILRAIGKQLNLEHFCTHSMRKTCITAGNNYCTQHSEILRGTMTPLEASCARANHSTTRMTARYIGADKDILRDIANAVRL